MTTNPGDFPHEQAEFALAGDGEESALCIKLLPHAVTYQAEMDVAYRAEAEYMRQLPSGLGVAEYVALIAKKPKLVRQVDLDWDERLGITDTNNLAINVLRDDGDELVYKSDVCRAYAESLTGNYPDLIRACLTAQSRYRESEAAYARHDSPENSTMTEVLGCCTDLGATEEIIDELCR